MKFPEELQNYLQQQEQACGAAIHQKDYTAATRISCETARKTLQVAESFSDPKVVTEAESWLDLAEKLKSKAGNPPLTNTPAAAQGEDNAPFAASQSLRIRFTDVIGIDEVKTALEEMVLLPLKHPDKARSLGIKAGGGILLYGPPGNGKTLIGKALAGEIDAPFFHASGADIRSKWHGESEKRLQELFASAREHPLSVVFLDEIDGLLPPRGQGSTVDDRLVNQFLTEIGGFEDHDSTLLLIGATNTPWNIDPAAFRSGRFDRKIYVPPPNTSDREKLLSLHLGDSPRDPDIGLKALAVALEGYTGSDITALTQTARLRAFRRSVEKESDPVISLQDLQEAQNQIHPSSTPALLEKYQHFKT